MPCAWCSSTAQITHPEGLALRRVSLRLATPFTLRKWIQRAEIDPGRRAGVTTAERERITALEREVKELRWANENLKLASAFSRRRSIELRFKA